LPLNRIGLMRSIPVRIVIVQSPIAFT
jgi:hypothetical protein